MRIAITVQKKFEDSLKYSHEAILLDNKLVEAYFQSAQNYCALGRPEEGKQNLVTAIFNEHEYAIKAASDGDICQYPEMLNKALIKD